MLALVILSALLIVPLIMLMTEDKGLSSGIAAFGGQQSSSSAASSASGSSKASSSSVSSTFQVPKEAQSLLSDFNRPLIDTLPHKQAQKIHSYRTARNETAEDIVAETVQLWSHLNGVKSIESCDLAMVCAGENFNAKCVNSKLTGKDEQELSKRLSRAFGGKSSSFEERCQAKESLESVWALAQKVTGHEGCAPSFGLRYTSKYLDPLVAQLFSQSEDRSKCDSNQQTEL